jgi:hypothetical protein
MKIKWRLYVDIYDSLTRKNLPPEDLSNGEITKKEGIKELFTQVAALLPNDMNYFKDPIFTVRTKSLTLESTLSFAGKDENQKRSPCIFLESESELPSTNDLQKMIIEFTK